MTKLFDLKQYRKHLEDYYKYPCDKDKILERKQTIDRYNDESISVNTMLFIMFAVFEIIFLALAAFFAPFNWHDVKMKLDMFIHKHRKTKQTEKNDDCASK